MSALGTHLIGLRYEERYPPALIPIEELYRNLAMQVSDKVACHIGWKQR